MSTIPVNMSTPVIEPESFDIHTSHHQKLVPTATLWLGIDVGSTTVKVAVVDPKTYKLLHWKYQRHFAKQAETVAQLIARVHEKFPDVHFDAAICGSGAEPISRKIGGLFVQEVVATAKAIIEFFPAARTCIELGGQDAKLLFFQKDPGQEKSSVFDMRMNGCCAGGTGAFLDQMASLLNIPVEKLDDLAIYGKKILEISGRCGVFAKTDLQPLVNMGVPKEDLALSLFHAVARQTISGLAQGARIKAPVLFAGGPLYYNTQLIHVFAEHLKLTPDDIIIPEQPQVLAAMGAALTLSIPSLDHLKYRGRTAAHQLLERSMQVREAGSTTSGLFFSNSEERTVFDARHAVPAFTPHVYETNSVARVYLGIDAGSTTMKFVLVNESGEVVDKFYAANAGDPLTIVKDALLSVANRYASLQVKLEILGVGTTGYGENLIASALGADYHTVETISHAHAALFFVPDASFILDIGGQDMKAIRINDGVITSLYLNEACSAGCGSFIETLAGSLNVPLVKIAETAFKAHHPSSLGSRCTVFMNSSVTTAQKNGCTVEDIIAGLCRSVVDNLFSKVVRVRDTAQLGNRIVVQGGTFKNDAVLRAFEQYTDVKVFRPPHPGEMGALGIALLTKEHLLKHPVLTSSFIGFDALRKLTTAGVTYDRCEKCANRCKRTIVAFSNATVHCTGNRCERGAVQSRIEDAGDGVHKEKVPCAVRFRNCSLVQNFIEKSIFTVANPMTIGIPRILEFYHSLPFWKTLFLACGHSVLLSPPSTRSLYELGARFAASDSICFPAKLAHGHVEHLLAKGIDRLFIPAMRSVPSAMAHTQAVNTCPIVQGYPLVINEMNQPHLHEKTVIVDVPAFNWETIAMRNKQVVAFLMANFKCTKSQARAAVDVANKAQKTFEAQMVEQGKKVLDWISLNNRMGVVLAGRPYHTDPLINHGIPELFSSLDIPLLTVDALPGIDALDLRNTRPELYNPFHYELYGAAVFAAQHPNLELVQLVSFGCGHDAIISDEVTRIMHTLSNKEPLVLKLDEGEAGGALGIRIRSFVESVRRRRGI